MKFCENDYLKTQLGKANISRKFINNVLDVLHQFELDNLIIPEHTQKLIFFILDRIVLVYKTFNKLFDIKKIEVETGVKETELYFSDNFEIYLYNCLDRFEIDNLENLKNDDFESCFINLILILFLEISESRLKAFDDKGG